jgi:hypothetical protein
MVLHNGAAEMVAERERTAYQRANRALDMQDELARTALGARSIGLLAMVGVGWSLWAKETGLDMRADARGEGRGGIVVEVAGARTHDNDGEITDTRAFRCIDPFNLRQVTLTEASIDLDRIDGFNRAATVRMIARLMEQGANQFGGRRGTRAKSLIEDEHRILTLVADMHRLAAACQVGGAL